MAIRMRLECVICLAEGPSPPRRVVATEDGVRYGLSELLRGTQEAGWEISPHGDVLCPECRSGETGIRRAGGTVMICFEVWKVLTIASAGMGLLFVTFSAGYAFEMHQRRRRRREQSARTRP